jgi:hypothetical protein
LALCRLAYEQGILQGDLNDLQQLALMAHLEQEQIRAVKDQKRQFIMMAIAMHPEKANSLLQTLEGEEQDPQEWAEPIPEDADLSDYVPVQQRPEFQDILKELQNFGMVVIEDQG